MLNCTQKETIYVVCSATYKTGGTELLHQLVYTLRRNGLNAYITYIDIKDGEEVTNNAFRKYVTEYKTIQDIIDDENSVIVLPEIKVKLIDKFSRARIAVWWLSVDNYLKVYTPKYALKLVGVKGLIWYIKNLNWHYGIKKINKRISYNLAQSHYAIDFLKRNDFKNIEYLSDYIGDIYLSQNNLESIRENRVLYNPKKGIKFTQKLMSASKDLEWVPIINMNNEQVLNILNTSKVYIDFGNHPGKDRFPREAAYCGCCILVGKRGSACFAEDVSIKEEYKFEVKNENIDDIIQKIRQCINEFESCQGEFDSYRNIIKNEKHNFNEDVKRIFLR